MRRPSGPPPDWSRCRWSTPWRWWRPLRFWTLAQPAASTECELPAREKRRASALGGKTMRGSRAGNDEAPTGLFVG